MSDNMQNEAMERLKQMYSKANPPSNLSHKKADNISENHAQHEKSKDSNTNNTADIHNKKPENLLDIFMRDKEKSLIVLLIVLLISEKADTTLILSLLYLIL